MFKKEDRLERYVERALERGASRDDIHHQLTQAGWSKGEINKALASFADIQSDTPVPTPQMKVSAFEAFFYLTLFSALYVTAFCFVDLFFDIINLNIPDPVENEYRSNEAYVMKSIRFSIAMLIVFAPTYFFMSFKATRMIKSGDMDAHSRIKKWLGYLTMYVVLIVALGAMVSLIYGLLMGDLTTKSVLKMTVLSAVSVAVFLYYRHDLNTAKAQGE